MRTKRLARLLLAQVDPPFCGRNRRADTADTEPDRSAKRAATAPAAPEPSPGSSSPASSLTYAVADPADGRLGNHLGNGKYPVLDPDRVARAELWRDGFELLDFNPFFASFDERTARVTHEFSTCQALLKAYLRVPQLQGLMKSIGGTRLQMDRVDTFTASVAYVNRLIRARTDDDQEAFEVRPWDVGFKTDELELLADVLAALRVHAQRRVASTCRVVAENVETLLSRAHAPQQDFHYDFNAALMRSCKREDCAAVPRIMMIGVDDGFQFDLAARVAVGQPGAGELRGFRVHVPRGYALLAMGDVPHAGAGRSKRDVDLVRVHFDFIPPSAPVRRTEAVLTTSTFSKVKPYDGSTALQPYAESPSAVDAPRADSTLPTAAEVAHLRAALVEHVAKARHRPRGLRDDGWTPQSVHHARGFRALYEAIKIKPSYDSRDYLVALCDARFEKAWHGPSARKAGRAPV